MWSPPSLAPDQLGPQLAITGDDATVAFADVFGAGDFRDHVELVDGSRSRSVITSHVYVHTIAAGAGCHASGDLIADLASGLVPALGLLVPWRRRRRALRPEPLPPTPRAT